MTGLFVLLCAGFIALLVKGVPRLIAPHLIAAGKVIDDALAEIDFERHADEAIAVCAEDGGFDKSLARARLQARLDEIQTARGWTELDDRNAFMAYLEDTK